MPAVNDRPGNGTVFGVVMGFVAGVLLTALVAPDHGSGTASTKVGSQALLAPVDGATATATDGSVPLPTDGSGPALVDAAGGLPAAGSGGSLGSGGTGTGTSTGTTGATGTTGTGARASTAAGKTTAPGSKKTTSSTKTGGTTAAGGPAAAGPTVGGPAGITRGVTDTAITIGIAYPDLTALKTLGPEYDNGSVPNQWKAWHDGLVKAKVLPINGRDVNLVFATYNVVDPTDQNTACRTLIENDQAFAVIGVAYFETGSTCVSQTYKTPEITSDGPSDDAFAASAPNLYSLSVSDSKMLRNLVVWADRRGALKGKKIGVYYANDSVNSSEAQTQVIGTLQKLGYSITAQDSTGQTLGGPEDGVAAQKFMSSGVNLAILLTSKGGFMQQADALGYKPTYIDSDHSFGTSDVATSNYPAAQYDGTYAITGRLIGEAAAGLPKRANAEACIKNYEDLSGDSVPRPGTGGHQSAVYAYVLNSCDLGSVLTTGLLRAGRNLGQTTFVKGIQTISDLTLTNYPPVTFTSRADGGSQQRTLHWTKDCTCWRAVSDLAPFFVQ